MTFALTSPKFKNNILENLLEDPLSDTSQVVILIMKYFGMRINDKTSSFSYVLTESEEKEKEIAKYFRNIMAVLSGQEKSQLFTGFQNLPIDDMTSILGYVDGLPND